MPQDEKKVSHEKFSKTVKQSLKKLILFVLTPRFLLFSIMFGGLYAGGVLDKAFGSFATIVVLGIFADILSKKKNSDKS